MVITSSPHNPFAFTSNIREEVKIGFYSSRALLSFLSQNRYLPSFPMYLDLAVLEHLFMQKWRKNQDLLSVNGASCNRNFARKERKEIFYFVSLKLNLFFFRYDPLAMTISHSKDKKPPFFFYFSFWHGFYLYQVNPKMAAKPGKKPLLCHKTSACSITLIATIIFCIFQKLMCAVARYFCKYNCCDVVIADIFLLRKNCLWFMIL